MAQAVVARPDPYIIDHSRIQDPPTRFSGKLRFLGPGMITSARHSPDGSYLLVDWKTSHRAEADPWQLAIYRLAWAELHDLPLERVRAAFHYVRSGRTVVPESLPDRSGLEEELLRATERQP